MKAEGKLIIITAPSGAGKTTVVRYLLEKIPALQFSISATTREKRNNEIDGKDYYFITPEQFTQNITQNKFVEWQEVYPGKFYGTLRSELERIWNEKKAVIFDVDVKGAMNLKNMFPGRSLSVFIRPPSAEVLIERLKNRKSESEASLAIRLERVKMEMAQEGKFDRVIVNDVLQDTLEEAQALVRLFLD